MILGITMDYQLVIAVAVIIIGAGIALKAGRKWGWLIMAGGIAMIYYILKYNGLV
jgi:hypothetical protein